MFWLDRVFGEAEAALKDKIASGKTLVIRDEKTASGRVHVGSMRGVALHGALSDIMEEKGIAHTFLYEINDFDAFDSLLPYIDNNTYRSYLGAPLYTLPSPEPGFKNYAEYFADEFIGVIRGIGVEPKFYYSHDEYVAGKYNELILLAIKHADRIRDIYKKVSGSSKDASWLPVMMLCEKCGKIATTRALTFDGNELSYVCDVSQVDGAQACGFTGKRSPLNGNAKLTWKVEWGAKFKVTNDDIEGEGKDLGTKGGARDVANHISREIFGYEPPFDIPYEFFLVGGKKMSTSKGNASSSKEVADLIPTRIFRLALLQKEYKQQINFDPAGDTIPVLFDTYDRLAEKYWSGVNDDDTRLFEYCHSAAERKNMPKRFLPRFSLIAFLVQMPHLSLQEEVAKLKGGELTEEDAAELELRATYAKRWLDKAAGEEYKFSLKRDAVPEDAKGFSAEQKQALKHVLAFIETHKTLDGAELHAALHEIRKEHNLEPQAFFGALYTSFLGKPSGPKAGWFLSVLDREFLLRRLGEVSMH
jgi:lysyl-tRNA synthetase class 1